MKVVIVEDQILFEEFLTMLVCDKLGHALAGVAGDGYEAIDVIRRTKPDLVILDILIPKLSGIHVARQIAGEFPDIRILALTSELDAKTVHQVHNLNLAGFVDKNESSMQVLMDAVREIECGRTYYSSTVRKVVTGINRDPSSFQKILTRREQEVLSHIGASMSDGEIGKILGLSDSAAQTHRRNILRKLNLHSTPQLIRFAHENGFWKPAFNKMGLADSYHMND